MSTTLVPTRATVTNQNRTTVRVFKSASFDLNSLTDVDTSGAAGGEVLVYDSNQGIFVTATLPDIDGGTF